MREFTSTGIGAGKGDGSWIINNTVALAKSYHYGPNACGSRCDTGQSSLACRLRKIRRSRSSLPLECFHGKQRVLGCSPLAHYRGHSGFSLLTGAGAFGLALRHALLPSRQLSCAGIGGTGALVPRRLNFFQGEGVGADSLAKMVTIDVWGSSARVYGRSLYGWLSSSLSSRPSRWLHGRHLFWLMFGVSACFSAAAGASVPLLSPASLVLSEDESSVEDFLVGEDGLEERDAEPQTVREVEGKQVFFTFKVTGVPGDGRCLFRAVAHGTCLRNGKPAPNEDLQRRLADALRNKAVDELIKRRSETEWFIEGNFDKYTRSMRQSHTWGGEPELLMLSHVLQRPITVYMKDRQLKGVIAIAEYGQEYGKARNPVRVLYHGFGHYEALEMPDAPPNLSITAA